MKSTSRAKWFKLKASDGLLITQRMVSCVQNQMVLIDFVTLELQESLQEMSRHIF